MPKQKLPRSVIHQEILWPTPYWHTIIEDFRKHETRVTFNEDMEGWVSGQMSTKKTVIKSNRGGWQSELQKPDDTFNPLVQKINEVCKNINLDVKETLITQLWVNVNKRGDWNAIHQHGDVAYLSGTYYVKVPKDSGTLVFRDPRPGAISNNFTSQRFDKGEFKRINLTDGLLMLWPSYLDHFVEPSQTDEERISISFDVMCR
jgi:uncharacterized protein (TIGR02466 family)